MPPKDRGIRREQRIKEELAAKKRILVQVQAQNRAQARKDLAHRRQSVGTLADEAGLFAWDDSTLAELFTLIATLRQVPNPVAVLEFLLISPGCPLPGAEEVSAVLADVP